MSIYFVAFLIAICGVLFDVDKNKFNRKLYLIIVFTILFLIAALRDYSIGTDLEIYYYRYYSMFKDASWSNLRSVTISGDWEWGFSALCKILCYISTDIKLFIVVSSALSIIPYGIFIYKNSPNVVFSCVMYIGFHVFTISLCVVRQAIAIGIILIGLEKLKQRDFVKYILFVMFASLFHTTALVCLIYIPLSLIKFKKYTIHILLAVTLIIVLTFNSLFTSILSGKMFSELYSIYSNSSHSLGYITYHTLGMFMILLIIFIILYINFKYRHINQQILNKTSEKKIRVKLKFCLDKIIIKRQYVSINYWSESMLLYSTYIAVLFRLIAFFNNVTSRISYYFIPFVFIAFPCSCNNIKNSSNKQKYYICVYIIIILFFSYITIFRAGNLWGITPYKSWL